MQYLGMSNLIRDHSSQKTNSFSQLFIFFDHLPYSRHLLNTNHVSGTILGAGNRMVNDSHKDPPFLEMGIPVGRRQRQTNKKMSDSNKYYAEK